MKTYSNVIERCEMVIPNDIITRTVVIGTALSSISTEDFRIRVYVKPSNNFKWKQTSYMLEQTKQNVVSNNSPELTITLPVTDQDGWVNPWDKSIVTLLNGATHKYSIRVSILDIDGDKTNIEYLNNTFDVPTGIGNLNFDESISSDQLYRKIFRNPLMVKNIIANSNFVNGHLYPG